MLASILFTLAACQDVASPLENYGWILTQYGEPGNIKTVLADVEVSAYFDSKAKIVSGSGGCNTYSGSYAVDHLTLTITGPLSMTKMSCGGDKDLQENEFINTLQKVDSYEVERGELIIYCGNHYLRFKRAGAGFKTVNYWQE
jgi:heat shock protein HslJ